MSTPEPRSRGRVAATACLLHLHAAVAATLLLTIASSPLYVQAPAPTERAAIQMALSRPAFRAAEVSRLPIAASAVAQAGLLPNPHLGLEHKRVNASSGRALESKLHLTQAFDISGRRAREPANAKTLLQRNSAKV